MKRLNKKILEEMKFMGVSLIPFSFIGNFYWNQLKKWDEASLSDGKEKLNKKKIFYFIITSVVAYTSLTLVLGEGVNLLENVIKNYKQNSEIKTLERGEVSRGPKIFYYK